MQETLALAMAVAATKIKILKENAAASLLEKAGPGATAAPEQVKATSPSPGGT